jgi:hypothetical protein
MIAALALEVGEAVVFGGHERRRPAHADASQQQAQNGHTWCAAMRISTPVGISAPPSSRSHGGHWASGMGGRSGLVKQIFV